MTPVQIKGKTQYASPQKTTKASSEPMDYARNAGYSTADAAVAPKNSSNLGGNIGSAADVKIFG